MDMNGERRIAAPREAVWIALNDPEVLKACIRGCESIEKLSDTELTAIVAAKIGPISARFNGKVTLEDLDPPNSYTIVGEGQGGAAGFGRGNARVMLLEEEAGTRLTYDVNAQVGGKMAQLGARVIDSVAKSYTETFFTRFSDILVSPEPQPAEEITMSTDHSHVPTHAEEPDPSNPIVAGLPIGIWIPLIVSVVVIGIVLAKFLG